MSNLGLLAGSSFMQILISLQMWGDMPGGMVGRRPSRATYRGGWHCAHKLGREGGRERRLREIEREGGGRQTRGEREWERGRERREGKGQEGKRQKEGEREENTKNTYWL